MAGLYIHLPFCHSKCGYCDFYSSPRHMPLVPSYIDAIISEWEARCGEIQEDLRTVYIGGGTPSALPDKELKRLCSGICPSDITEFTIEVNPEDISRERAEFFRSLGINRVSMGVQSLDDDMLRLMGRRHSAQRVREAYMQLREGGFDNISLDLIYGLPWQTPAQWIESLTSLLMMRPEHLSAYLLSYEKGTRFSAMLSTGKLPPTNENTAQEMYGLLCSIAAEHGYEHYEISNFCRKGFKAVHNSSYWDMTPYIGLGAGAHSFDGYSRRRINRSSITDYISSPVTTCEYEEESDSELYNDFVITQLRTSSGLSLSECSTRFGQNAAERFLNRASKFIASGAMNLSDNNICRITEGNWLVADSILVDLID